MSRITGKVKWFNNAKGYGFIEQPGLFRHLRPLQGRFRATASKPSKKVRIVEFEVTQGPEGGPGRACGEEVVSPGLELSTWKATEPLPVTLREEPASARRSKALKKAK